MDMEKKMELLADMFEMDATDFTAETNLDDIDAWDSMTKLSLIVMADEECGKKLTGDIIRTFKTVGDILDFMG